MADRRIRTLLCGALVGLSLSACGADALQEGTGVAGSNEAYREGLALPLEGVNYNVFITRQLNLADPEDSDYVDIDEAPPGSTYYGVFLEACNITEQAVTTASTLFIENTLGERFEPIDIEGSIFAYESAELEPGECIPADGSIPDYGPTGGALLVFEMPIEATENRPLELHIVRGFDGETGGPRELLVELDI